MLVNFKTVRRSAMLLLMSALISLFFLGCSNDYSYSEAVVVPQSSKLVAYSVATGEEMREAPIIAGGGAYAMAFYNGYLYIGTLASDYTSSYLYVFDHDFNQIKKIDLSSWTDVTDPYDLLIVDDTHAYMAMQGSYYSQDGSVIEFNPTDFSLTSETVINADSSYYDHPTALCYYDQTVYATVYTTNSYASYVYDVTDEEKLLDLSSADVSSAARYKNYLYCSCNDYTNSYVEVVNLDTGATSATVEVSDGSGDILINGTAGYIAGGCIYSSGYVYNDNIYSFDATSCSDFSTSSLSSEISDWGGGAVLGASVDGSDVYAISSSGEVRIAPFSSSDVIADTGASSPSSIIALKILD